MRFFSALFSLALLLAVAGLGVALWAKSQFDAPGPARDEMLVNIPRGTGLSGVAATLEAEGVVRDARIFNLAARMQGVAGALKAGEYAIPPGASMREILEMIAEGRAAQHKITIAEGLSVKEALALLGAEGKLTGEIADAPPEGSLAPNTYFFQRGETRADVMARMQAAQAAILAREWENRAGGLMLETPEEALILASIIEKETGLAGERALVSGVFHNRLKRGMRLQSDPTVIYGLTSGEPLERGLRRSELDETTPYNTYRIDGLPPGPIANPGADAIRAALNPERTDALYFVADGEGGHVFAKTLEAHNANVRAWRKIERERLEAAE